MFALRVCSLHYQVLKQLILGGTHDDKMEFAIYYRILKQGKFYLEIWHDILLTEKCS